MITDKQDGWKPWTRTSYTKWLTKNKHWTRSNMMANNDNELCTQSTSQNVADTSEVTRYKDTAVSYKYAVWFSPYYTMLYRLLAKDNWRFQGVMFTTNAYKKHAPDGLLTRSNQTTKQKYKDSKVFNLLVTCIHFHSLRIFVRSDLPCKICLFFSSSSLLLSSPSPRPYWWMCLAWGVL